MELDKFVKNTSLRSFNIENYVKRKYLPIKEKFEFLKEFDEVMEEHKNDYDEKYLGFVQFVFFNLLVVKKYTDLEFELTYESFDKLQEKDFINQLMVLIQTDYGLLLTLMESYKIKN